MLGMANYDGHVAKRQRTDYGDGYGTNNSYYNNNYGGGGKPGGRPGFEEKPNHILLITVNNPAYPITTDVIHKITSPSGTVLRIVIFKKNGVQSMVEFDSIESASRAKDALDGCDIYSGCCTLRIEYAKPKRLNVYKNDGDSWDYTDSGMGKSQSANRPALLQEPPSDYGPPGGPGVYNRPGMRGPPGPPAGYDEYNNYMGAPPRGGGPRDPYGPPGRDPYGPSPDRYNRDPYGREGGPPPMSPRGPPAGYGPGGPMAPNGPPQGAVIMLYGLGTEMNADRLFNILCLYGNVARIKFLKSKEACAMIQMGDPLAVERTMGNLNGATMFGSKLQVSHSKQPFLKEVQQPFELPDGTPSFKDFMGNRNNRFSTPEAASKNRILQPSKIVHFFNAPANITEDELKKVFEDQKAPLPTSVKLFNMKNKQSERSSSGLLEFESSSDALEAIAFCNHIPIPNPGGKFPFIFKLCFSTTASSGGGGGGGGRGPRGGGGGNYPSPNAMWN